ACWSDAITLLRFVAPNGHGTRPSLFPYTTLFRSRLALRGAGRQDGGGCRHRSRAGRGCAVVRARTGRHTGAPGSARAGGAVQGRSAEHTSELQSRENLVCRLLLVKKNIVTDIIEE